MYIGCTTLSSLFSVLRLIVQVIHEVIYMFATMKVTDISYHYTCVAGHQEEQHTVHVGRPTCDNYVCMYVQTLVLVLICDC